MHSDYEDAAPTRLNCSGIPLWRMECILHLRSSHQSLQRSLNFRSEWNQFRWQSASLVTVRGHMAQAANSKHSQASCFVFSRSRLKYSRTWPSVGRSPVFADGRRLSCQFPRFRHQLIFLTSRASESKHCFVPTKNFRELFCLMVGALLLVSTNNFRMHLIGWEIVPHLS